MHTLRCATYKLETDDAATDDNHLLRDLLEGQGAGGADDRLLVDLQVSERSARNDWRGARTVMPGRPATSEPVAMTMFLAAIFCLVPSSAVTVTSLGPVIVPVPLAHVT